ncbi:PP0621 family protein [Cupriavidus sp. 30B13]|uniref:PP0621 family protein n=1 Tax=Cupriavidus sp. 30B13 TaxID=3384241 RepID=UPI003B90E46B
MARIVLVLAVLLGCLWWLRQRAEERQASRRAVRPRPPAAPQEAMVQCARCAVHLPRGEAIAYRGLHYCRRAHLPPDSDADDAAA